MHWLRERFHCRKHHGDKHTACNWVLNNVSSLFTYRRITERFKKEYCKWRSCTIIVLCHCGYIRDQMIDRSVLVIFLVSTYPTKQVPGLNEKFLE
jgi:hypothetical protein